MAKYPFLLLLAGYLSLGAFGAKGADSALGSFENQLREACLKHDLNIIKSLYDFEGSPQALIDERIYGWQQIFADVQYSTVKKIEFTSLDEAKSDPQLKATLEHLKPVNMNGTLYGLNLSIVGFAKITFESKTDTNVSTFTNTVDGKTTTKTFRSKELHQLNFPLGILSDGSYRITMSRVLK